MSAPYEDPRRCQCTAKTSGRRCKIFAIKGKTRTIGSPDRRFCQFHQSCRDLATSTPRPPKPSARPTVRPVIDRRPPPVRPSSAPLPGRRWALPTPPPLHARTPQF